MARVLLTGASGFLGVHATAQLLDSGYDVRAFVRSADRLWQHLEALHIGNDEPRVEVHVGDVTDPAAVREAVAGCEAAVHAAATFSYQRRDVQRVRTENALGTRNVLEAAVDAGCGSVVQVSSIAALIRRGAVLDHRSPLGEAVGPYTASKIESERLAREHQAAGAPVAIVNPGAIIGPHDPYLGESNRVIRDVLRGRLPTWPRGGIQFVDVRDTAAVVVAALARPGGRFLVPGENVVAPHPALSEVTGRRLPCVSLPVGFLTPALLPGYLTGVPFLPGALEGVRFVGLGTVADASATLAELDVTGRTFRESLVDTARWLVEAGHLAPRYAGRVLT